MRHARTDRPRKGFIATWVPVWIGALVIGGTLGLYVVKFVWGF